MKKTSLLSVALLVATSTFFGCSKTDDAYDGNVNWENENGSLELVNGTGKDIVVFKGQTPAASGILGGIRAGTTKTFDISDDVPDYGVGGYIILRGITREEFEKYETDLSMAKVEFSAMATYKDGEKYRVSIARNSVGDYGFIVSNTSRLGIELRKNSPEGEKIAYLPALTANQTVYSATTDAIPLYPVFVYYNRTNQTVTTLNATSVFDQVNATPRPLANTTSTPRYTFPSDPNKIWKDIVDALTVPTAYITVNNGVPQQAVYFTIAGSNSLLSQSGYDAVGSGEQLVYEVESTEAGAPKNFVITFYNGAIQVPVRFEGESTAPIIKNAYDYEVSIERIGGNGQNSSDYKATIVEREKRDLTEQIESL